MTRKNLTGPAFILTAAFFFGCMNLGVRSLRGTIAPDVLIFYRSLFQVLALLIFWRKFLPKGRVDLERKLVLHFARGIFGVTSMLFMYASMQRLPLGLASLLTMSNVFWATFFSAVFLKETLSTRQKCWGALSVLGLIVAAVHPGVWDLKHDTVGIAAGLLAGFCAGVAFTILRSMRKTLPTGEIVFYFGVLGVLVTGPLASLHFQIPTTMNGALMILLVSVCATIAQLCLTQGFKDTTAGLASLINLQQTTFSVILGMIFLNEWPDLYFYIGTGIVFVALRNFIVLHKQK